MLSNNLKTTKRLFYTIAVVAGLSISQVCYAQLGELFKALGEGLQAIGKSLDDPTDQAKVKKQEKNNNTDIENSAPKSKENKEEQISENNMSPKAAQSEADTKRLTQCDSDLPTTQWSDCTGISAHMGGQYEGEFRDGKPNGKGILVGGGVKAVGEWIDGKLNGRGRISWADGEVYEGEFKNHERNGHGKALYANGFRYEGEYKNDQRSGQGISHYKNGARYEGEWLNNKRSGQGIFYYPDGSRYEGGFLDNLRSGRGVFYRSTGNRLDANWVNDKPHGSATEYLKKQNITRQVEFDNGNRVATEKKEDSAKKLGALAFIARCFYSVTEDLNYVDVGEGFNADVDYTFKTTGLHRKGRFVRLKTISLNIRGGSAPVTENEYRICNFTISILQEALNDIFGPSSNLKPLLEEDRRGIHLVCPKSQCDENISKTIRLAIVNWRPHPISQLEKQALEYTSARQKPEKKDEFINVLLHERMARDTIEKKKQMEVDKCLGNTGIGVCVTSVDTPSQNICSDARLIGEALGQQMMWGGRNRCLLEDPYHLDIKMLVKNHTNTSVKDIKIMCAQLARSGTRLSSQTETVYDIWQSNEKKELTLKIRKHEQVQSVNCSATYK